MKARILTLALCLSILAGGAVQAQESLESLEKEAKAADAVRDWPKAQKLYGKILALKEAKYGKDSLKVVDALNEVVRVTCVDGKCTDTIPYLQRMLAIRQKHLGENHTDTATSYLLLAETYEKEHKYPEAEKAMRRCQEIRAMLPKQPSWIYLSSQCSLARILKLNKKYEESWKICNSVKDRLKSDTSVSPAVARQLNEFLKQTETGMPTSNPKVTKAPKK